MLNSNLAYQPHTFGLDAVLYKTPKGKTGLSVEQNRISTKSLSPRSAIIARGTAALEVFAAKCLTRNSQEEHTADEQALKLDIET